MQHSNWSQVTAEGVLLHLWIKSGAKHSAIAGVHAGRLKVTVGAPAIDSRANQCLVHFIADVCGLAKNQVTLVSGLKAKQKTVLVRTEQPMAVLGAIQVRLSPTLTLE